MPRHTLTDLKQMQSLSLEDKITLTKKRIAQWYDYWDGDVYLCFSGGVDSTVLKNILDSMYSNVPSVFVNTGLEYPEVREFALKQKNVIRVDPQIKFYDVVKKYGYPVISKDVAYTVRTARRSLEINPNRETICIKKLRGTLLDNEGRPSLFNCQKYAYLLDAPFKISEKCCHYTKREPLLRYQKETGRYPIVGTMTEESRPRRTVWLKYGCNAVDASEPMSKPISFWRKQDILEYVLRNKLEYASVYGEIETQQDGTHHFTGLDRTGCMFCMFGITREKYPNRFQQMQSTHPKQYKYCMEKLGIKQVLDYIGVPYEDPQLNLFSGEKEK